MERPEWNFVKNLMASMDTLKGTIEYVHMWYGMAIPVVLYTAGLQMVPDEIYESAKLMGQILCTGCGT